MLSAVDVRTRVCLFGMAVIEKLSPHFIFVSLPFIQHTDPCHACVRKSNTLNDKNYVNFVLFFAFLLDPSFLFSPYFSSFFPCDNVRRTQFIRPFSLLRYLPVFSRSHTLARSLALSPSIFPLVITLSLFPHTCRSYVQYSNETYPSHSIA